MLNPEHYRKFQNSINNNFIQSFEEKYSNLIKDIDIKIIEAISNFKYSVDVTYTLLKEHNVKEDDFIRYIHLKGFQLSKYSKDIYIRWFKSEETFEDKIYAICEDIISNSK